MSEILTVKGLTKSFGAGETEALAQNLRLATWCFSMVGVWARGIGVAWGSRLGLKHLAYDPRDSDARDRRPA